MLKQLLDILRKEYGQLTLFVGRMIAISYFGPLSLGSRSTCTDSRKTYSSVLCDIASAFCASLNRYERSAIIELISWTGSESSFDAWNENFRALRGKKVEFGWGSVT